MEDKPEDELPVDELPEDELPEDELPEDELPEDELPENALSEDEVASEAPGLQLMQYILPASIYLPQPSHLLECSAQQLVSPEEAI